MELNFLQTCRFHITLCVLLNLNLFPRFKRFHFSGKKLKAFLLILLILCVSNPFIYSNKKVVPIISSSLYVTDKNIGTYFIRSSIYSSTDRNSNLPNLEPFILWSRNIGGPGHIFTRGPVLEDVNNDGRPEVIGFSGVAFVVLSGENGTLLWNISKIWMDDFALGDMSGDGRLEVILSGYNYTDAYNGSNGAVLWEFTNNNTSFSPPILCDIDGDGKLEVLFSCVNSQGTRVIYALNGEDGSSIWNVTYNLVPKAIAYTSVNDRPEIIASSSKYVCALNSSDGSLLWNFTLSSYGVSRSVAVGDINGDGESDIVFGTRIGFNGYVVALNGLNGTLLWQQYVGKVGSGPIPVFGMLPDPILADVDSDGKLEVITDSGFVSNITALNGEDGSLLWNSLINNKTFTMSPPSIGDINGDNKLDVIVPSDGIYALNGKDGKLLFNLSTHVIPSLSSPALGDIDGDGKLEIVYQDGDGNLLALDFHKNADSGFRTYWPCFGGNSMRSGSIVTTDPDMDMLSTHSEKIVGTNSTNPDTDGDGMPDGWEVSYGLNATNASDATRDSDNDGLTNLQEYEYHTDPTNPDTDGDGMPDGWEVSYGLNATNAIDAGTDLDGDGLTNLQEYEYHTDPTNPDTDGDGIPDGWEVAHGYSPTDNKVPIAEFVQYNEIWILVGVASGVIIGYQVYKFEDKKKRRRIVEKEIIELLNKKLGIEGVLNEKEAFQTILNNVDTRGLKRDDIISIFRECINSAELKKYEKYKSWIIAPWYSEKVITEIKGKTWISNKPIKLDQKFSKHISLPLDVIVSIIMNQIKKFEEDTQAYLSTKTRTIYPLLYLESLCDTLHSLVYSFPREKVSKELIMEKMKQLGVPEEDISLVYELLIKQLCIQRIVEQ